MSVVCWKELEELLGDDVNVSSFRCICDMNVQIRLVGDARTSCRKDPWLVNALNLGVTSTHLSSEARDLNLKRLDKVDALQLVTEEHICHD